MADEVEGGSARSVGGRIAAVAVSCVLLGCWLIPGTPVNENKPLAQFPTLSASGLANGSVLRDFDAALEDRMGLKAAAIQAVGNATTRLGLSGSEKVVFGPTGEPFFSDDFTLPCLPDLTSPAFAERLGAERDKLAARGEYFLFSIVPDKSSVERAQIGWRADALMECADRDVAYLSPLREQGKEGTGPVLTAWHELGAEEAAGRPMYLFGNTHWNSEAGTLFAGLLFERLVRDGQAPPDLLAPGEIRSV